MGYIKHNAIVVTSWDEPKIISVHENAKELFGGLVSEIIKSRINGYMSFFVAPDGSKEGWEESKENDNKRHLLVEHIESNKYEDGSNSIRYAELFYGEDKGKSEIVNHN